jgi:hypothetical protein
MLHWQMLLAQPWPMLLRYITGAKTDHNMAPAPVTTGNNDDDAKIRI